MKKFTRLMCISAMLLIAGSNEVWALRYAKAVIYAEPANGGYVGFDSNPTKDKAEASDYNGKVGTQTFTFNAYQSAEQGYIFKGWATSSESNSGTIANPFQIKVQAGSSNNVAWAPATVTYYAIFARMTADKSSIAYDAMSMGESAQQTITIVHAHAGKITATVTGSEASDFIVSSTTPVANSVSEGTQEITVTFSPTCNGTRTATLTLHSDNGLSDVTIALSGEALLNQQTLSWLEPIDPNMTIGSTMTIGATATSGLEVVYSSSNPAVVSVEGNTLNAKQVGTAVITASQAGDCTYSAAEEIQKEFTVSDKATPVMWLNNDPEQTEAHLKVGESVAIQVENITEALQITCGEGLSYTQAEETITLTATQAVENTTLTLTQPETGSVFAATRTFAFHITKRTATLTHHLATDYMVDDEIALAEVYTATNGEVDVMVESSNESVLKVEAGKLHAVGAGTATITLSQPENDKWTALRTEQTLTVSKYANTIVWTFGSETGYSKTLSYDENIGITCASTNNDIESSPIAITQTSGEDIATYDEAQQTITASFHNGTATWTVSQPENYKYLAAEATITVTVAALQGGCYVVDKTDEVTISNFSTNGEITWADINAAETLTFDAKMQFWSTGNMEIEAYVNGSWNKIETIGTGSLSSDSYKSFSYPLSAEVQGIRFKNTGTLSRYVKNVKVSRRQHITPSTTTLTMPTNELGGQTTAILNIVWSSCAEEIRIISNNPKFAIDREVISTNGGAGEANITVTYSSDEMENSTADLTLYTLYQQTTVTLTATTGKKTQPIVWDNEYTDIPVNTTPFALNAKAEGSITYTSSDPTIAYVEDDTLYMVRYGEVTITAMAGETELYKAATMNKVLTISALPVEIYQQPTLSDIWVGQTLGEATITGGKASTDGQFVWETDTEMDVPFEAGQYTVYVQFIPANTNWYTIVERIALTLNVVEKTVTAVVETETLRDDVKKIIRNGQVYIIRGEKVYTIWGGLIKN